jgi:hypothetical protein
MAVIWHLVVTLSEIIKRLSEIDKHVEGIIVSILLGERGIWLLASMKALALRGHTDE